VLNDYHHANAALGHQCVTLEDKGQIMGFAYYAPAAMTDRTWYLYWIAVKKQTQARGLGQKLLLHTEDAIRKSRRPDPAHRDLQLAALPLDEKVLPQNGYDEEATLRDFYADGDHLVVV